jgi:hypothetical protein
MLATFLTCSSFRFVLTWRLLGLSSSNYGFSEIEHSQIASVEEGDIAVMVVQHEPVFRAVFLNTTLPPDRARQTGWIQKRVVGGMC